MAAALVMQSYYAPTSGVAWTALGASRLTFSNTPGATNVLAVIDAMAIGAWNLATNVADTSGPPPLDQCKNPHVINFRWISTTQWKITASGAAEGATATLVDSSVSVGAGGSFGWHFTDVTRQIQNCRFYSFQTGGAVTIAATDMDIVQFVGGQVVGTGGGARSTWYILNDYSALGGLAGGTYPKGGDLTATNPGDATTVAAYNNHATTNTVHDWYCAASVSIEAAGAKTFSLGMYLEYI